MLREQFSPHVKQILQTYPIIKFSFYCRNESVCPLENMCLRFNIAYKVTLINNTFDQKKKILASKVQFNCRKLIEL